MRLDLVLNGVAEGNLVNVAVQDPLIGAHELLRIDLRMDNSGRVRCLLDVPDQVMAEGGRFWIALASQAGGTIAPDSTVQLLHADEGEAREEYLALRLFLLKGYFYALSEGRPFLRKEAREEGGMTLDWLETYGGGEWMIQRVRPQLIDLYRTVEHLVEITPDHPIAAHQYYEWLVRHNANRKPVEGLPEFKARLPTYWNWAVAMDRGNLRASLEYALYGNPWSGSGGVARYLHMWTAAEKFTDRVFIPMEWIGQPMLGGYTVRNKLWPGYAVSYENLGGDFAALVLAQGRTRLKIAMVNLRDSPRSGAFRVWQLEHGEYEVRWGPDANDDGEIDAVESSELLNLARMDEVPVHLPPRKLMIVELEQKRALDSIFERPDLALSARDVTMIPGGVQVRVHNIGAAPAEDVVVTAYAEDGTPVDRETIPLIEAPSDLVPRHVDIALSGGGRKVWVRIDPDNRIPEITELNNDADLALTP